MMYLIAYDVGDSKARTKISDYLCTKGRRMQKSVFMIDVSKHEIKTVLKNIGSLMPVSEDTEQEDSILCIPLCVNCSSKIKYLGYDMISSEIY